jgi:uncharacterized protein (TIGR00255 family)
MALASMTGFGRAGGDLSARLSATVVAKSVNHRYLDVQVRTSVREEVPEIEAEVRSAASRHFSRGRVNVQVNLEWRQPPEIAAAVNAEAVRSLVLQLRELTDDHGAPLGSVEPGQVLALPGLISVSGSSTVLDDDELRALGVLVDAAAAEASAMRVREGDQILGQLETELAQVASFVDWFEPQMSEIRERVLERSRARILDLVGADAHVDPDRIAQEAAVLADRADVAEEVVRLRAHLETFGERLAAGGVVGRTLDFLCQEIHRELNTLGSKCREVGIGDRVVDAKTALERVREQVQNIE